LQKQLHIVVPVILGILHPKEQRHRSPLGLQADLIRKTIYTH
jgi:hypothetical protein